MFYECRSLTSLYLSSFNTQSVQDMKGMFYNCYSLTSLNLSNFDTSHTSSMYAMFYNNTKLKEIHLPNIATTSFPVMIGLFFLCPSLNYINIRNYKDINYVDYNPVVQALDAVPENVVVCIDDLNASPYFFNLLNTTKRCHTIYCGDDWVNKQKKNEIWNKSCLPR